MVNLIGGRPANFSIHRFHVLSVSTPCTLFTTTLNLPIFWSVPIVVAMMSTLSILALPRGTETLEPISTYHFKRITRSLLAPIHMHRSTTTVVLNTHAVMISNLLPMFSSTFSVVLFPGPAPRLLPRNSVTRSCKWNSILTFWMDGPTNSACFLIMLVHYLLKASPPTLTCASSSMIYVYAKDVNTTIFLTGTCRGWIRMIVVRIPVLMWGPIGSWCRRRMRMRRWLASTVIECMYPLTPIWIGKYLIIMQVALSCSLLICIDSSLVAARNPACLSVDTADCRFTAWSSNFWMRLSLHDIFPSIYFMDCHTYMTCLLYVKLVPDIFVGYMYFFPQIWL